MSDKLDGQFQPNAGLAFDEHLRERTRRTARPSGPGLEARAAASGTLAEIDFVGRSEVWIAADGHTITNSSSFVYDAAGRLLGATNSAGTYALAYTNSGQVESVQEPFGASLNFQYDAYGDRTLVTDSFSGQLTTNYNANSLATATTFTGGGITMEVDQSYNGSGQVTSQTMLYGGSAVVTGSWSYTPAGAVQSVAYQNSGASWNDTLSNAYNADGQVTSQADDLTISGSGSTTTTDDYGYDESGQLTSENSAAYNYDVNGNPTDVAGNTGNAADGWGRQRGGFRHQLGLYLRQRRQSNAENRCRQPTAARSGHTATTTPMTW